MIYKYSKGELKSPEQTAAQMLRLSVTYQNDLGEKKYWSLPVFFKYVAALPYKKDPANIESISRPGLSMRPAWPWRDCDDKSILLGSWCAANGIPFRFIASSNRPDKNLHHVFVQAYLKKPIFLDATYKKNILGDVPKHTFLKPLTDWYNMAAIQILEGSQLGFNPFKNIKRKTKNLTRQTKNIAKKTGKAALKPAKYVSKQFAKLMPKAIKNKIAAAVESVVGNRKLSATAKAAIIGPATAAALAIPGVQPWAAGVPMLVSEILDGLIKKAGGSVEPKKAPITQSIAEKKAAAIASAKKKAGSLKVKKTKKGETAAAEIVKSALDPAYDTKKALIQGSAIGAAAYLAYRLIKPKK